MLYTMRTFLVDRANVTRFVELSETAIWPALEGRDGRALGLWQVVMGGAERIVLITRYESLAHWQQTRAWPENRVQGAQPDRWPASGREAVAARAAITRETDVIALQPLGERRPPENTPDGTPGIYALRSFQVRAGDVAEFVRRTEAAVWPWYETQGARPLGMWRAHVAEQPLLWMLTRYADLGVWEASRDLGPEPEDATRAQWQALQRANRSELVQASGVRILRPISSRRP
ncbi:MAG TPA: NIPSNAP family protein [Dehalococcoidia bacterium]|nr:NIPSNAP family protein [Dehalococcoidia bacterium]